MIVLVAKDSTYIVALFNGLIYKKNIIFKYRTYDCRYIYVLLRNNKINIYIQFHDFSLDVTSKVQKHKIKAALNTIYL